MANVRKPTGNSRKKPIEQCAHKGKQRANNPPVELVTPAMDGDRGSSDAGAEA
jgi:hypothetical protein